MHSECAGIAWEGIEEHAEALRAYLARHCRDQNQADDVAQEALVRAARFRAHLQDVRNLRGWMLRIGSSVLRDHLRRERRLARIDGGDELLARYEGREPEPGEFATEELLDLEGQLVERAQLMSEVDLALVEADEPDREVLARLYGAGLCCETLGTQPQGCGQGSTVRVKSQLFRARKRLYRRLTARVRCVVRCGDEFAPARLAATCTGGGALALLPDEPGSGATGAQRG
jgi:RNA polymerase sigma factor (sigma-70 family)